MRAPYAQDVVEVSRTMIVIGLMSGTSMDALDAALVEFDAQNDALRLTIHDFAMQPYDAALREQVRGILPPHTGSTADVCALNVLLGEAFASAALALAGRAPDEIALIASHGQTVYHQVAPGAVRSTLQLGAPAVLAERTGCTVVADFRPRDIAAGGQGAPLVPYLDVLLLHDDRLNRASQNIGGMGNVTYVPAAGPLLAFDTGPGNVLIDEAVRLSSDGALHYDRDGAMAARGDVDDWLVQRWLAHPFFHQPPPKSTGREQWGPREARAYVEEAVGRGLGADDVVATLTAFAARSIAHAYAAFLGPVDEVVVGGGGARNPTLMAMLGAALPHVEVRPTDDLGLHAEAKEAVAFALLGYATVHGWSNNVPAATGATHPVVLGSITPGANYPSLVRRVAGSLDAPPRRIVIASGGACQR
jgi:anhydro-N-acetylmuramic acid kinase